MKYLNSERLNIKIPKYEEVINAFIPSEIYIPLCIQYAEEHLLESRPIFPP